MPVLHAAHVSVVYDPANAAYSAPWRALWPGGPASAHRHHAAANGLTLGAAPPLYQKSSDTHIIHFGSSVSVVRRHGCGSRARSWVGKNIAERAKRRSSWRRSPMGRQARTVANPAS